VTASPGRPTFSRRWVVAGSPPRRRQVAVTLWPSRPTGRRFEADGQTLGSASGSATRDAGLSDDYSGTWTIVWTVGGDSATFDVTITNSATNDPVYMFVKLPYNGGMVLSGSVVGGQFALTAFSAAGTNGLLTKFLPTSLPGGGAVTGTRVWPGGGDFSGTYTIAKSTN